MKKTFLIILLLATIYSSAFAISAEDQKQVSTFLNNLFLDYTLNVFEDDDPCVIYFASNYPVYRYSICFICSNAIASHYKRDLTSKDFQLFEKVINRRIPDALYL